MKEHGHLFQDRFLSKKIEDREYFKTVCKYIHQNPVKAGICGIDEYMWSSYQEYVKKCNIINPKMLLALFTENKIILKDEFVIFNKSSSENEVNDFLEYEMKEKLTDEQLLQYICELVNVKNACEILKFDKKLRNKLLVRIKQNKKIKSSQIARVLGMNRKIVERAK